MKYPRPMPGQSAVIAGAALAAVLMAATPAAAAYLRCDSVRTILRDCIGTEGGAEEDSCQPAVDQLALAVGPQPLARASACVCVHDIESQELHYHPNRDAAALNKRLADSGLYAWDCGLLVTQAMPDAP
ncbi:hypothetical protein ACEZDB_26175 [Streptacidiphilus sp. N1-3]|uniref:Secreted protein n=1 Tax=Streptacidiphilus alkalitolerans TaxID=3342712 RepID=A0ABV6X7J4_9ACTN